MKQETKDRFKTHWKKIAIAVITLGAALWYVFTGVEIDPTPAVEFLQ